MIAGHHLSGELMHTVIPRRSTRLVSVSVALIIVASCGRGSSAGSIDTSAPAQSPPPAGTDTMTMLRGTVASATGHQLVVKTDSATVTVRLSEPFQVFDRAPSDLSQVKDNTFIGVTTVKQPDGSEQATEIHIFPDALRGLGEGSRMMTPAASGGAGNRMTNGSVSASRMTNGTASGSRMSNGTVAGANGTTLVVQYSGGSQKVMVPANVTVTEIKPVPKTLSAGDRVVVVAKKQSDGSLASSKALLTSK
jgi:hypothetical protein